LLVLAIAAHAIEVFWHILVRIEIPAVFAREIRGQQFRDNLCFHAEYTHSTNSLTRIEMMNREESIHITQHDLTWLSELRAATALVGELERAHVVPWELSRPPARANLPVFSLLEEALKGNIGLSDSQRKAAVRILTTVLADEFVLYVNSRCFH
jgi:hypothetical protein